MYDNKRFGRGVVVDNSKGNTNDSTSSGGTNYGLGFLIIGMFFTMYAAIRKMIELKIALNLIYFILHANFM